MSQVLFDKLEYVRALQSGGVEPRAAEAHADALDKALRETVATKSDISALATELRAEIRQSALELKIWAGGVAVVLFGALVGIRFFGA